MDIYRLMGCQRSGSGVRKNGLSRYRDRAEIWQAGENGSVYSLFWEQCSLKNTLKTKKTGVF